MWSQYNKYYNSISLPRLPLSSPYSLSPPSLPSPLTDKGIAFLARIVRKTEEFFLIKLKQLTGEGLKNLTSRALKHLSLHESNGITNPAIIAFIRNCPNIEKICVAEVHKLSDATLICAAEVLGSKLASSWKGIGDVGSMILCSDE